MKRRKCVHPHTRNGIEKKLKTLYRMKFTTSETYMCYCPKCKHIINIYFPSKFPAASRGNKILEESVTSIFEKELKKMFSLEITGIEYTSKW
jgi:hypothetical protein